MSHIQRIFSKLAGFSFNHALPILTGTLVLALLSPLLLKDLRFDSVTTSFGSSDDGFSLAYKEAGEMFGDNGHLIIHLLYDPNDKPVVDDLTDILVARLSGWEDILLAEAKPLDLENKEKSTPLMLAALINSGPDTLDGMINLFTPENMERELRRTRRNLLASTDPETAGILMRDPLGIRKYFLPFYESRMGNIRFSRTSEYFESESGNSRLIFIQPLGLSEDINYSPELIRRVGALITEMKSVFPGTESIRFQLTGKYALTAEGGIIMKEDLKRITLLALALIMVMMWTIFRNLRSLLLSSLPLLASLIAVFIFARLIFNPLNSVALAFAAIIIGLGVDILLHCTARYYHIRVDMLSPKAAVEQTLVDCGPPIFIGISTTAAAFFCLIGADYPAMTQFGLLTSGGLMLTLATSLFLFPAAVRLLDRKATASSRPPRLFLGFGRLFSLSFRKSKVFLIMGFILVAAAIPLVPHFRFDMDLLKSLPKQMKSMAAGIQVSETFGASFILNTQMIIDAADLESAMKAQEAVDNRLTELVKDGVIAGYQSPSLLIPYLHRLEQTREQIARAAAAAAGMNEEFFRKLEELKFHRTTEIEAYYSQIENLFQPDNPFLIHGKPSVVELPRLGKFLHLEDNRTFLQTYVWPFHDVRDFSVVKNVSNIFEDFSLPPQARLQITGTYQVFERVNEMIRADFFRVGLVSLVTVLILILVYFRRIRKTVLAIIPLAAAIPMTFAALVVFKIPFTPTVIGMTAMIIGIGIDDAVHILTRARSRDQRGIDNILKEIGPVLTLTTLSTMIGFGALMMSRFDSLKAMGFTIAAGVLGCWLFTLLFLPPLLKGKKGSKPVFPPRESKGEPRDISA